MDNTFVFVIAGTALAIMMVNNVQKPKPHQPSVQIQELNTLKDQYYKGTWYSEQSNQFNYLSGVSGDCELTFKQGADPLQYTQQTTIIDTLKMYLMDPKYLEGKVIQFALSLDTEQYNPNLVQWKGRSALNYSQVYKFDQVLSDSCNVDYLVKVNFPTDQKNVPQTSGHANITVKINDPVCNIAIQATLTYDTTNYEVQIVFYCVFAICVCTIQFISVTQLCKELIDEQRDIQRISLLAVGYVTVYDAFLCLINLYYALQHYLYFQYFVVPAFFYFLLATTCDMKLIWLVWRDRFMNIHDNQQMRRAITFFFVQFYTSLIAFFVLMYFFQLENWFILLTSLFIMTQIVHNATRGNRPRFNFKYVFGVLATNISYPLYFRGCPNNFRGQIPSQTFCILWISSFLIQITLLLIQQKYGSRSFLPRCLFPKQFNYFKTYATVQDEDCAICLGSLCEEENKTELLQKVMQTPCNHNFHVTCLVSWMDVKLQCPVCRSVLPPLDDQ